MTLQVAIQAPAKLNLGLEVIGRRADGYHDIVTIFQAVSLCDDLLLSPAAGIEVLDAGPSPVGGDKGDNLVAVALDRLRRATGTDQGAAVTLTKRIPIAAGLGGASSDAAAALAGARALWQTPISDQHLRAIGAGIGSDVSFFFAAGTALGTDRGDTITPLPPLVDAWFVIVSPRLTIPGKTPLLYRSLTPADFTSGGTVRYLTDAIRSGRFPELDRPPNTFSRPLYAMYPELAQLSDQIAAAGATAVGLSGAGPTHFALVREPEAAAHIAARLRAKLAGSAAVAVATPVVKPPAPVLTYLKQGTREFPRPG